MGRGIALQVIRATPGTDLSGKSAPTPSCAAPSMAARHEAQSHHTTGDREEVGTERSHGDVLHRRDEYPEQEEQANAELAATEADLGNCQRSAVTLIPTSIEAREFVCASAGHPLHLCGRDLRFHEESSSSKDGSPFRNPGGSRKRPDRSGTESLRG